MRSERRSPPSHCFGDGQNLGEGNDHPRAYNVAMEAPPPPPPPQPPSTTVPQWDATGSTTRGAPDHSANEVALFAAVPAATPSIWLRWIVTLGFYEIWRRRTQFIVTNRRVVWRRGLINRSERSVPLSRVQDVTTRKGLLTGWVELSSAGGWEGVETLGLMWNPSVDRMAEAIDRQVT